jgi:hypothetical protein
VPRKRTEKGWTVDGAALYVVDQFSEHIHQFQDQGRELLDHVGVFDFGALHR